MANKTTTDKRCGLCRAALRPWAAGMSDNDRQLPSDYNQRMAAVLTDEKLTCSSFLSPALNVTGSERACEHFEWPTLKVPAGWEGGDET